jgi:D-glycero-alpha-D-manno-heptose-7-phosphate kinase
MIITQTPLRVGLVGGGTDLPSYYREHGGRVLNAAIDKYVYVVVKQRFDDDIYLNYSRKEIVSRVADVEHELVREAMHMSGVRGGVEITTLADIPSAGSGLGSSSAVTVGLLHALFAYQGRQVSAEELAERACTIEIDRCGKPIGKQDQYAAAFGGICDLRFGPGDQVTVDQIRLPTAAHRELQGELMLFYTGITRVADTILGEQKANVSARLAQLDQLRDLASEAVEGLRAGDTRAVGVAMGKSWDAKRQLASGVSTAQLDEAVEAALAAGATGAKVTGAGGGGFVLVSCPAGSQTAVREALSPMRELPIAIDPYGSRVIFNVHRDIWS